MGYPLYGNDLNDKINLANTSLRWVINSKEDYLGKKLYNDKPNNKRVGIKLLEKGIARDKMEVFNLEQQKIGVLTSAGYSPTLNISIGQAYIDIDNAITGKKFLLKLGIILKSSNK